jgi:hypothetical protein
MEHVRRNWSRLDFGDNVSDGDTLRACNLSQQHAHTRLPIAWDKRLTIVGGNRKNLELSPNWIVDDTGLSRPGAEVHEDVTDPVDLDIDEQEAMNAVEALDRIANNSAVHAAMVSRVSKGRWTRVGMERVLSADGRRVRVIDDSGTWE